MKAWLARPALRLPHYRGLALPHLRRWCRHVADWEPKSVSGGADGGAPGGPGKAEALLVCREVNAAADVMAKHV